MAIHRLHGLHGLLTAVAAMSLQGVPRREQQPRDIEADIKRFMDAGIDVLKLGDKEPNSAPAGFRWETDDEYEQRGKVSCSHPVRSLIRLEQTQTVAAVPSPSTKETEKQRDVRRNRTGQRKSQREVRRRRSGRKASRGW